ncbi:MAG: short chain dehydrogenase [Marmoricola sp.]|nr:short chain dehydrogenase [Marmoricola sp.]
MNLADRTVLITGGASGIGAATARHLAEAGARVALLDREESAAADVAAGLPHPERHLGIGADVTSTPDLTRAVERTAERFGGIDVVVANAGVAEAGTVATADVETLARTVEVNLTGVIRTVHAALPAVIERRGYVLLVSSAAALKNVPGGSSYAASKAGVEAFGGALRLEVAHRGVAVGVAHPAWVRTPMVDAQWKIDAVREGIQRLPWPFGVVTDVDECARIFVRGIEHRSRKVYVPGALAVVDKVRPLFTGRLWDALVELRAKDTVPALEAELRSGTPS